MDLTTCPGHFFFGFLAFLAFFFFGALAFLACAFYFYFQSTPGIPVLGFSKCFKVPWVFKYSVFQSTLGIPVTVLVLQGVTSQSTEAMAGAFFFFAAVSWVRASDVLEIVFFTSSLNPHVFSKYSLLRFALQSAPDSHFILQHVSNSRSCEPPRRSRPQRAQAPRAPSGLERMRCPEPSDSAVAPRPTNRTPLPDCNRLQPVAFPRARASAAERSSAPPQ